MFVYLTKKLFEVSKNNIRKKKIGLPPGTIVFTGNQKVEKVIIHYLKYDENYLEERTYDNHTDIPFIQANKEIVDWYDVRGIHDVNLLEAIGNIFEIHPLILEDIADVKQRPKFEEYLLGLFITIQTLSFDKTTKSISSEQIGLYFREGLLISFQENESDLFHIIRKRVEKKYGKIRSKNTSYLAYALLDCVIDNYFYVFESIELEIELLEEELLDNPGSNMKSKIHHLKKELLVVRRTLTPLREAISQFAKTDSPHIDKNILFFIRDLYDHTIQVMDFCDTQRDILNGLQDLYLSEISFKMNQVIQVLTIITTIFVPLSFLAGLYGMNFENMPELNYEYGYYVLLGVMALILVGSLAFFKKKNWF